MITNISLFFALTHTLNNYGERKTKKKRGANIPDF
jgi:hypothetical protein